MSDSIVLDHRALVRAKQVLERERLQSLEGKKEKSGSVTITLDPDAARDLASFLGDEEIDLYTAINEHYHGQEGRRVRATKALRTVIRAGNR